MLDFLALPERTPKPRAVGISHVIDTGMGIHQVEDLLSTASDYIDILKLGWGTGYVTQGVFTKIKAYHQRGIPVCFGGTFLELAILQNRIEQFRDMALSAGVTHVEISNGVINMSAREKGRHIAQLAKDFVVLSEVGSKDSEHIIPPFRWVELIEADLDAGAWKVICEARESGTVGLYFNTGEVRAGLVEEIVAKIDHADVIFEAPLKSQQVYMIKKFGTHVNLGNIAPADLIGLETLRLGLRAEAMPWFHQVEEWNAREEAKDVELKIVTPKRRSQG